MCQYLDYTVFEVIFRTVFHYMKVDVQSWPNRLDVVNYLSADVQQGRDLSNPPEKVRILKMLFFIPYTDIFTGFIPYVGVHFVIFDNSVLTGSVKCMFDKC